MTTLAEKIDLPEFGFAVDHSVTRMREHSIALDRCKRFSEIPRISFEINLKPLEWAVFAYYYSLAPNDHPSELTASTHLKIGRNTLGATLDSLATKSMLFFDIHARSKLRIVNISHPIFWNRAPDAKDIGPWTDPATHVPRLFPSFPERINDAKYSAHAPGQHVRLPYLLFHTLLHPTSKYLYGLLCYLGVHTHPTTQQIAAALRCSAPTAALRIAELEDFRMIYSDARDPVAFGEHIRYFYHLTDVAFWKTRRAAHWYAGGENSLIVRLDAIGFPGRRNPRRSDETEDFRPVADASRLFDRSTKSREATEVRQVISQIRQESSEEPQISFQVRQISPQIRQDGEASQGILFEPSDESSESSQIRQIMPRIRQDGLRQITSQIRQNRFQIRQNRFQIRQNRFQIRQIRSQSREKSGRSPCTEPSTKDFVSAKNTIIRNKDNKNTVRNELRARERWTPVDVSFHPRLINIAQAASIVWRDRDYRWDRALWNRTVEEIALERGEKEAVRFVSYVKDANTAWGREFPYSPQLMQTFLDSFRAGKSWAAILGPRYEEQAKAEIARHDENPGAGSGSQNHAVNTLEPADRQVATPEQIGAPQVDPGAPYSGFEVKDSADPEIISELRAAGAVVEVAPDPKSPAAADISSATTKQTPGPGLRKPKPVQLTHANLLDFPADGAAREKSAIPNSSKPDEVSAEPSTRRKQLENAITVLTSGMKRQSRDSLRRGFEKLSDNLLFERVCFVFGAEHVHALISTNSENLE